MIKKDYLELWNKLEAGGKASGQAAAIIEKMLH